MQLKQVSIHNFRGVIDATVALHPYSLIVGANNCGKTTLIDGIRAFYEKDGFKFKEETDFPQKGSSDDESWIELSFQLTEDEHDSLKDTYKTGDKTLRVRKYFKANLKLHDGKSAAGAILAYGSDGKLSKEPFYGAKNVQSGKFGDVIYIRAISKVDDHTKLSGPSALRDLLSSVMSDVVEGSESYKELEDSVGAFASEIRERQTEDNRSLSLFEEDLNLLLEPWNAIFSLNFSTPSTSEIIKSMLGWDLQDSHLEKPLGVDSFGSGFQRHFIYSLIRLGAKYSPKKVAKKSKDFTPSLNLILFEEPEAFLHPPQQEALARSLVKMSSTPGWQVVCSTHSANFVSRNASQIPTIVRMRRNDGVVYAHQIDSTGWQTIIDSNKSIEGVAARYPKLAKALQEDDSKPDMEAVKYALWLNPDRAGMLFSQQVLLVEGPSESALLNRLLDDDSLNLPNGTYVLDCIGKYNIHRFMALLSGLGVAHAVLHDDDDNKDEHGELNQLIIDTRHPEFTLSVQTLPKDLESVLGIPHAGSPHRKPQHILYCYENGRIDNQRLADFCTLVAKCFSE